MSGSGAKKLLCLGLLFIICACTNADTSDPSQKNNEVFENVTGKAAIKHVKDSYSQCWSDLNNDGLLDIVVINHAMPPYLLINNSDGTFRTATPFHRTHNESVDLHGCAIGDYDNDGDQDVYITVGAEKGKGTGSNRLYQNNGNGKFINVASEAGVTDPKGRGRTASWADYNNDGFLDLFAGNAPRRDAPARLFRNTADGRFVDASAEAGLDAIDVRGVASWIDYDNDGYMDLTIKGSGKHGKSEINIIRNVRGVFKPVQTFYGSTYAWGDYDNDGDPDLFVSMPPKVRLWGLEIFEFSGLSLFFDGYSKLYENTGGDTFIDVSEKAGFTKEGGGNQAFFFDYDNDGDLDMYLLVNGTRDENIDDIIFRNNGDKTFTNVTRDVISFQKVKGGGCCVAYGDYNNDGALDLFFSNGNKSYIWVAPGAYELYENKGNHNHWLKLRLVGTRSNKDGIGARVKIHADGHSQYRQNNGGMAGYVQNSRTIHFGLGDATSVDKLEVIWPGGSVTALENIRPDQLVTVKE